VTAGGTAGTFNAAQGPSLQTLYNALQEPWLSDSQREIVKSEIERQQKANDPATQLEMEYRRAQIEALRAKTSAGDDAVFGTPIYGRGPDGKMVLGVINKNGTFQQLDTGGVEVTPGLTWQDFGTYRQGFDKSGAPATPPVTKENYQEAFDKDAGGAAGKAQAEAAATLPTDLQTADQAVKEIDELIDHPGLSSIVGPVDQYRPSWTMGAEGRDALARFNQAKGRAFLQAFGMLKGGGQITEIEGAKAEQAMARMDRAQGEAEFKQALEEFRDAVKAGAQKMRERAGTMPMPASQNPAPVPSAEPSVDDLLKKYGG
jgi:flagellar protein FlgJ